MIKAIEKIPCLCLKKLREELDDRGIHVEIVADEWCNNLDDIKYFADNNAGHILQIKTPDLGGLHHIAEAILYCKEKRYWCILWRHM